MSYRELRNFTEQMRALGYPRLISVENFRKPNFELVANVLFWMVNRYDQWATLPDSIETEDDRVEFLTAVAQIMAGKARINLKTKNLYAADGRAVKELLKISSMLYQAMRESDKAETVEETEEAKPETKPVFNDLKTGRAMISEITEQGATLYDLLEQEASMREARTKALRFLDAVSGNLDSGSEHQFLERKIRDALANVTESVESLEKQISALKSDKKNLEAKINKRKADLDRNQSRLQSLANVRPPFMDEYERLESELAEEYETYVERFRNLDYLEHELDVYNKREREKVEMTSRALKKMQKQLQQKELEMFMGDAEGAPLIQREEEGSRPPQRAAAGAAPQQQPRTVMGRMDDSSDDESTDDSDSGSDSDGQVSMTGSGSGTLSDSDEDDDDLISDEDSDVTDSGSLDSSDNSTF